MQIKDLRGEIAAVDREILELVARRRELARAIGEEKDRKGKPLRDFTQEREVIERSRDRAEKLGLSAEVAEDLMERLILYSLTVQERQRVQAQSEGSGRRALVIGGAGRMGGWVVRFLDAQEFDVEIADPVGPVEGFVHYRRWQDAELDHDFIIVTADLRESSGILDELADRRPRGVVFDIGSLKTPLRAALERLATAGVAVTSIHPLFGPDTELLSGRHVVFVDVGHHEATARARELFAPTMATLVDMELDDHDRYMAYVLGLSHAANLAFLTALTESGESGARLGGLSSTTFEAQFGTAARVATENPHLYYEIQSLNEYGKDSLGALLAATERLHEVVTAGDEEGFVSLMKAGRAYAAQRELRQAE